MNFINITNGYSQVVAIYKHVLKVVDDSEYRPDSELVRSAKFNPQGGDSSNLLYDYKDGKIPENDKVSKVILSLRSGKLDRAEFDMIKDSILKEGEKNTASAELKKLSDAIKDTFTPKKEGNDE